MLITKSPTLNYFDLKLKIKVSSDASTQGLGSILEQQHKDKWYPVAYASRSLSSAEENNCPLELEMLSILFACEQFNDHKPQQSIINNPICKGPPHMQRFLMRIKKI